MYRETLSRFSCAASSIILWIVLITELIKPSKEQNGRKIVMLLTAGSVSTLILTVSFIQNISFWN
ncbi:hypothetical protein AAHB56_20915 [Bacillus thuringiensis]